MPLSDVVSFILTMAVKTRKQRRTLPLIRNLDGDDNLLTEILIRALPNPISACQCKLVSNYINRRNSTTTTQISERNQFSASSPSPPIPESDPRVRFRVRF
ncbi:hypothetical protein LINPERHAP2_LOCUS4472 [Linum perenne]